MAALIDLVRDGRIAPGSQRAVRAPRRAARAQRLRRRVLGLHTEERCQAGERPRRARTCPPAPAAREPRAAVEAGLGPPDEAISLQERQDLVAVLRFAGGTYISRRSWNLNSAAARSLSVRAGRTATGARPRRRPPRRRPPGGQTVALLETTPSAGSDARRAGVRRPGAARARVYQPSGGPRDSGGPSTEDCHLAPAEEDVGIRSPTQSRTSGESSRPPTERSRASRESSGKRLPSPRLT